MLARSHIKDMFIQEKDSQKLTKKFMNICGPIRAFWHRNTCELQC